MIAEMIPDFQVVYTREGYNDTSPPTMEVVVDFARRFWGRDLNPYPVDSPFYEQFRAVAATAAERASRQYLQLPEVKVTAAPSKRRIEQPRVKPVFASLHDIRLRLNQSCIFIGSELYYVTEIYPLEGDFLLTVLGKDEKKQRVWYKNELIDLRSMEPQYVSVNGPVFIYRPPSKSQRQGMGSDNLLWKPAGCEPDRVHDLMGIVRGFNAPPVSWSPEFSKLMAVEGALPAIRLSKNIAFYRRGNQTNAEYKGRLLGYVHENAVYVDENDYKRPWIDQALRDVNCVPRMQ